MVNEYNLHALSDTKISGVNLYSGGQAEITRIVQVAIKSGPNQVTIKGLPIQLLQDTVRVDGHGKAIILDVVFSDTQVNRNVLPDSDPLKLKRAEVVKAHQSAVQARQTLSTYLGSATVKDVNVTGLDQMLDEYAKLTAKVDRRILEIDRELATIDKEISAAEKPGGTKQVSILLVGDADEEIELFLKYAVRYADWIATYDIRVDTQSIKENITITYKALITQNTGESWDQAPLTLETIAPSSGIPPTTIQPWNISVHDPVAWRTATPVVRTRGRGSVNIETMESPQAAVVSEKTGISASYQIPGLVDIPSNGAKHYVTIAKMKFTSKMLWYSIPKVDTRAYLKTSIKNDSEYSFVPGNANVFVDGSFVASVPIPSASPQEVFDCPLGMDPSVRITYHTRDKKATHSGFMSISKTSTVSYVQRITVQNTKSIALEALRIIDNIPVSQDERIQVKLISPPLPQSGHPISRKSVSTGSGVSVQWHGADDEHALEGTVGKDGKLNWVLNIPPMKTVNLALQFEVTAPPDISVQGIP